MLHADSLSSIRKNPRQSMEQYQCKICSAHATGFHFDAQSCSACAAFFRRTVSLGKTFRCLGTAGSGLCPIFYKNSKHCRCCRFAKCIQMGMQVSAVQPKKDGPEPRAYCTKSGLKRNKRFASAPLSVESLSNTESVISEDELDRPSPIIPPPLPTPPTPMPSTPTASTLRLLIDEEMRITERRRIMFCERPVGSLLGVSKDCAFTNKDIKPLCFRKFRNSIRTHILLIHEWLRAWPDYSLLSMNDQIALLRKCVLYHTVLDPCYITLQIGETDKFVMQNGGYVSRREECNDGWEDEREISHESKKRIYWPLLQYLTNIILEPMIRMAMTFDEFVALKAFVSFQGTMCDISDEGRPVMKRTLDRICRELHDSLSGSESPAERLGNIILLLSPIFDTALKFVESHHEVHFFDLWQLDPLLLQFLKNKV